MSNNTITNGSVSTKEESKGDEKTGVDGEPAVEYEITLRREYGLVSAISLVVGIIIGSGIFISPQGVLRNTGSVGLCLVVWSGGAVLSVLGALTYTELVSVIRKSGIEYAAIKKTIGRAPGFVALWSSEVTNAASRAVQALSFAEYVFLAFQPCGSPDSFKKLIGVALLILLTIVSSYSVRLTARLQVVFTAAKLVAVSIIICGGIYSMAQGTVSELPTGFEGSVSSPSTIAMSFYSVMFAYSGWNNVNLVVEELKRPRRNAPLASILGVAIVGVVYILVNVSYFAVLSKAELLQSSAVALSWGNKVLGPAVWIIPVSVIMSVFGSANGSMGTSTRTMYVAARDGVWFEFLSYINVKRYTPVPAILFQVSVSIIFLSVGSISTLINFLGFTSGLVQTVCAICVIILRFRRKEDEHRIKIPIVIPILFALGRLYLVIAPIIENPQIELLYAAVFVVGGLVIYFPLFFFKFKPNCFNKLEMYIQLFLEVAPGGYDSNYK